ncbi:MAG: type IX secretion system membrane protein PorP/SprF [Chitinophagales bacterium]
MQKNIRILIFSFLVFLFGRAIVHAQSGTLYSYGQQDPQFTQYMFNPAFFNPAAVGTEPNWVSTANIRNQWVNLPGAPISQVVTSHLPIYRISSGAGISIVNDIAGQQRITGASLSYAYHKTFRTFTMSLGLSGGMYQWSVNGDKLVTPTGTYENIIDHNDPNLPVTFASKVLPDASAGLYFFGERFTAGVSAAHVITPLVQGGNDAVSAIQYNPDAYVYLAYRVTINNKFELTPNVLYKTDLRENMVDINAILTYNDNVTAGISFRGFIHSQYDAIALMAGMRITDRWRLSYAYDITTSPLSTVSSGSHELVVRYAIPVSKPKAGKMINNPRYLYH